MPIGIIVWLLLIIIIAVCACPGFLAALGISLGILIIGIFIFWLIARLIDKREEREYETPEESAPPNREEAIKEWEKKWGRIHPTRK